MVRSIFGHNSLDLQSVENINNMVEEEDNAVDGGDAELDANIVEQDELIVLEHKKKQTTIFLPFTRKGQESH